jgi:hypothetical protein
MPTTAAGQEPAAKPDHPKAGIARALFGRRRSECVYSQKVGPRHPPYRTHARCADDAAGLRLLSRHGEGLPLGEPGSVKALQLVVEDIDAVRQAPAGRGVGVSDGQQLGPEGTPGSRSMFFEDPDGNGWAVQEIKRS